ncbi:hypothetical protein [Calothrix sp. UHCC 0171]|uniref:hypothetical protein n=1 Tax=Calothrix sp. UHCC 0171 TaxID=3110245 RepID=UPI002B20652A|nr:hypothetical protein [Calothrix sp. UHCC 0171]MEA5573439.1 hypothetical protein [Calothrix sp. UHCC 0171]
MVQQISTEELQTHSLQIDDIVSYLQKNGWQILNHPNPRLLVFQGDKDDAGNPIQLVLPSQNSFEDSDRLLTKAINLLAAIAQKPPQEIIDAIADGKLR